MADGFITFTSGRTLTVAVLTPAGAARGSNPHSATEFGSTGLYKFTEATMVAGDLVRVTDSVFGYLGGDEYLPEVKDTAAILEDTGELQTNQGNWATATGFALATVCTETRLTELDAANLPTDMAAIKAETALIVADTNELQTDNIPSLIAALPTDADVNTACDTAISDAAIPAGVKTEIETNGSKLDHLWETTEDDGAGVRKFTEASLVDAPSGTGASAITIADAVWDEATSGHTTAGTFGEQCKIDIDAILVDTGTDIPAAIALVATGTSITTLIQQSSGQTNVYDERTK